jgi:hypothetical protein
MGTLLLRKMILTTIVTALVVVAMALSLTVFSISAPMASGERIVLDSEQLVTVPTNGNDQNNATDRHTSSLSVTQSPENGLDVECGGDLKCEILDNNTVVATTTGQNTTTTTMITGALNALNQSLTQSFNQSNLLLPFGDNDFDMLDDQDLDSGIDQLIDQILNGTLGDMQPPPLQTLPDLRSASV